MRLACLEASGRRVLMHISRWTSRGKNRFAKFKLDNATFDAAGQPVF